jgi:16S rRNA (cytosine967-C5)-methyltransferase
VACERVEPQLLDAVRLGAYQLLFLDRVPSHAAVSDAVEVAARRGRRPAGFANAVLRKVADHGREAFARLSGGEGDAALAVRYSLPVWVVRRWRTGLGAAAEAAFAAATDTPERCLRVNRLHATPEQARAALAGDGVETTTLEDWPDALVVTSGPALETTRAFTEGLVTAQSRGSQLVGRVVADAIAQGVAGEREGEPAAGAVRVADLCAAPGGKAAHVAALAPGAAVTAFDIDEGRCAAMRANLERLGAGAVRVVVADALGLPDRESDRFGHVLLDAPCSGLGVLATRPDLRWRRDEAMLRLHAGTEAALLASAARLVVPGGSLTYAVCSFERDETLAVVAGVDELDGWPADDLGAAFPEVAHPADPRYLLVVPGRDGSSGFFVARLRRPAR